MKRKRRVYYTEAQKTEMWDRWQKSDSFNAIGRHFDTSHSAISGIIWSTGGIRPLERKRSRIGLTLWEREEISRGLVAHLSLRSIASQLGRSPSTISRVSIVMEAGDTIEPIEQTKPPGIERIVRNNVNWQVILSLVGLWRGSS